MFHVKVVLIKGDDPDEETTIDRAELYSSDGEREASMFLDYLFESRSLLLFAYQEKENEEKEE